MIAVELGYLQDNTDTYVFPTALAQRKVRAYVCLRSKGRRLAESWGSKQQIPQTISEALTKAKKKLKSKQIDRVDAVECNLAYNFKRISLPHDRRLLTNLHRGVKGIQIGVGVIEQLWSPTTMLARNLSFYKILESHEEDVGPKREQLWTFDAQQLLIKLTTPPERD